MERTEIEQKVRAFLIDDLEIDEDKVFPESRLKEDMGIDSLDYVDIVAVVLSTFGIKVNIEKMKAVKTLSQFIDYLEEELKQKCKERAKIFQQAMESCHSSSPIDCIEWFADRIADLEKENAELKEELKEWKDECQEQVQKATDEGYARTLQTMQLTKAKVALRNVIDYLRQFCSDYPDCVIEAEKILKEE
jgi:acyl carrier protein